VSDSATEVSDIGHFLKACWRGSNIGAGGITRSRGSGHDANKRDIFLFPEFVKALSVFDMKLPYLPWLPVSCFFSRRPLGIERTGEQIQARWLGRTAAGAHYGR
jgi:hypothetical protein